MCAFHRVLLAKHSQPSAVMFRSGMWDWRNAYPGICRVCTVRSSSKTLFAVGLSRFTPRSPSIPVHLACFRCQGAEGSTSLKMRQLCVQGHRFSDQYVCLRFPARWCCPKVCAIQEGPNSWQPATKKLCLKISSRVFLSKQMPDSRTPSALSQRDYWRDPEQFQCKNLACLPPDGSGICRQSRERMPPQPLSLLVIGRD